MVAAAEKALDDETIRQCMQWQYADRQMRTEDMIKFVNVPDCEEGYPLLKCELPPGEQLAQHALHPPPFPDEEPRITRAFGNLFYSKVVRLLNDKDNIVYRQKAVQCASELLCVPDSRVRCLAAGLLPILANMLNSEKDVFILQELALCFKYASASDTTWDDLCKLGCVTGLVEMVGSNNLILRGNALSALNDACLSDEVRKVLIDNGGTLRFILFRVNEDEDRICIVLALDVLSKCVAHMNYCQKALTELLKTNTVSTALRLTEALHVDVKEAALRFLCLICFDVVGKHQAVQQNVVPKLLPCLKHSEPRIQAFTAATLMSITISVDGKHAILNAKGVPYLQPMLDLSDDIICLNILQLLINTAEHPEARKHLQSGIGVLRGLILEWTSALLKRCGRQAIQQLQFKSRPFANLRFVR